ncbi:MAG: ribosome maturation factor RimM [Gammaproteobacteria bacterium]
MSEPTGTPLVVGRVSGVFGTRGWLKVQSHTRPFEQLLEYVPWLLRVDGQWREQRVREARRHHGTLIVALDGVADRDTAAGLVRADIAVLRSQLPAPAPGEFYWVDLVGLTVVNRDDVVLGEVRGLLETGAHDVVRVAPPAAGASERLIPFVREVYVLDIDLAAGIMRVDWHADD